MSERPRQLDLPAVPLTAEQRQREHRHIIRWQRHIWRSENGDVPCILTGVGWGPVHEIGIKPPVLIEIQTRDGSRRLVAAGDVVAVEAAS